MQHVTISGVLPSAIARTLGFQVWDVQIVRGITFTVVFTLCKCFWITPNILEGEWVREKCVSIIEPLRMWIVFALYVLLFT